jgi:hypothetical protein
MMADEGFIQFIWKHKLYDGRFLYTSCGQKLEVLDPGEQNFHGGPDFLYARIRIDCLIWVGNVEIHRQASDWYRHRHHLDPAYNNVILHVVGNFNTDVTNSLGRRLLTFVPRFPAYLNQRYEILKRSESWLACGDYIKSVPMHKVEGWLLSLNQDRMGQKCMYMQQVLQNAAPDMNLALFRALSTGFGIPLNALPFELLAKRIPLQVLSEHRDNVTDLEALLFGQSGLLSPARILGSYPSTLWNRYHELKKQLEVKPLPFHLWKFLRLRPSSFPTLRISQLARLFHLRYPLADSILGCESMVELEQVFRVKASEYWTNHYLFGKVSAPIPKYPGQQFISTLIINIIVPFLTALDKLEGSTSTALVSGEILQNLKAESNQFTRNWSIFGIKPGNASESQALLHLYRQYCKQKRCLECRIGSEIVRDAIRENK